MLPPRRSWPKLTERFCPNNARPKRIDMKVLAIEMSRVTSLFQTARRSGQLYLPHVFTQLADRYSFVGTPNSLEDVRGSKAEFTHGLFDGIAIETLELYNDGIIVTSRSDSELIDKFMNDLIPWIEESFGLSIIHTHKISKMYDSTLVVETERDVFKPLSAYIGIKKMIEKALWNSSNLEITFENFGLSLSADQTQNPALKPTPFRFERKVGIEFSLNQYYTTAPLTTKQHVEILEKLEQII